MRVKKVLMSKDGEFYSIADDTKDYHMEFGVVKKEDFAKATTSSNAKKKLLYVVPADFMDNYKKIKRLAQIMHSKELGIIIAETGVGPESTVIEAGSGSGASSCFLARYVKHVYSYDIHPEHQAVAKENAMALELNNITFELKDITKDAVEKNADLFLLDFAEPWTALDTASQSLKIGGYLVTYNTTILQISQTVNAIEPRPDFIYLRTIELIRREWHIEGKSVRPAMQGIGHTGFLSFFRKVQPEQ